VTVNGKRDAGPVAAEGAETDFSARMSYADYLELARILGAQKPLSDAHDELLFIIQHQTSELWMKLAIHEIEAAMRTMTPSEYTSFRDRLGKSSGFQSWQYRAIEFLAGNRNDAMLAPHAHLPEVVARLEAILEKPSLYDEALLLLSRRGFDIGAPAGDWRKPHKESVKVMAAWKTVYQEPAKHWELYELAEKLVDFEDYFRRWRFNHVTTVERIIGMKRGTGGTAGVSYLRRMLEVELFPELWKLRTEL
jgi:tryptophan 2,3-dioxygenase